jgi:ABC-type uncharacterized transport system permease subunit
MTPALGAAAIACYVLASVLLGRRLVRGQAGAGFRVQWFASGAAALALHAAVLYPVMLGGGGLNLGFFHVLSLMGWAIALTVLLGALFQPVENLGLALFPAAAVTLLLEMAFPAARQMPLGGNWAQLAHVALSIAAYSLLTLAAMQSVLLWLQHRQLHGRRPGSFVRALPPLQTMETLLFQMLALGFVLLTLALFAGAFFVHDLRGQHLLHKAVLSALAWAVFGGLLWGRWRHGWRGRTAIRWTLAGFAALLLAYFGSKAVLELLLNRSWG